jgi:hypothetical protein
LPTVGRNIAAPSDTGTPARSAAGHSQSSVPSVNQDSGLPLVCIKPQSEPTRPLFPVRYERGAVRVVKKEPAHDRETVGVLAHRVRCQLVRVGVPQHRVNQRAIHAGGIHAGNCLLRRIGFLTMMGGRRTFFPEVDLSIDDQH